MTDTEQFECIHCGSINKDTNHWIECIKHPARKIILSLCRQIKDLEDEIEMLKVDF